MLVLFIRISVKSLPLFALEMLRLKDYALFGTMHHTSFKNH